MKTVIKSAVILAFIILGWILYPYFLEWSFQQLKSNGYSIVSVKPLEQFYAKLFFALIFGLIPTIMWILSIFLEIKRKKFELFGLLYLVVFGVTSLKLRSFFIVPIRTHIPEIREEILFSSLKINQYLLIGIFIGCLLFLVLGLLFKQITLKKKDEKRKGQIEENIGEIGTN